MSSNLKNKISDWLEKHGYPFEMAVANLFQSNGFQVAQSVMYLDQDTQVPREIDIVAHKSYSVDNFTISFAFVIECKAAKAKPWVSFLVNSPSGIDLTESNYCTKDALAMLKYFSVHSLRLNDLFPSKISKYGYSLTQALRENESTDITYKALQSLNKSIEYFIKKLDERSQAIVFYFPIVAIDCPLFEVELLPNNKIELQEVETSTYLGRQAKLNNLYFVVDVVTHSAINVYAKNVSKLIDNFMSSHKENVEKFVEEYNNVF